jgi:hypothetical protein
MRRQRGPAATFSLHDPSVWRLLGDLSDDGTECCVRRWEKAALEAFAVQHQKQYDLLHSGDLRERPGYSRIFGGLVRNSLRQLCCPH